MGEEHSRQEKHVQRRGREELGVIKKQNVTQRDYSILSKGRVVPSEAGEGGRSQILVRMSWFCLPV